METSQYGYLSDHRWQRNVDMSEVVIHEKHKLIRDLVRGVDSVQGDSFTTGYKINEYAHGLQFILLQR